MQKSEITENNIKCCANCEYCIKYPRGNKFNDIDYMCAVNGYFLHSINKDITKIKHLSPGGKELQCKYKNAKTKTLFS